MYNLFKNQTAMKTKIALIFIVISLSFISCNNKHFEQLENAQKETLQKVEVLQQANLNYLAQISTLTNRVEVLEAERNPHDIHLINAKMERVDKDVSDLKLMQNEYAEDIKRLHDWHWWWVKHWGIDYKQIK